MSIGSPMGTRPIRAVTLWHGMVFIRVAGNDEVYLFRYGADDQPLVERLTATQMNGEYNQPMQELFLDDREHDHPARPA